MQNSQSLVLDAQKHALLVVYVVYRSASFSGEVSGFGFETIILSINTYLTKLLI